MLVEHLIAGAAAGASNHETGAVTDGNDLGLMGGGDDKLHEVDRAEMEKTWLLKQLPGRNISRLVQSLSA